MRVARIAGRVAKRHGAAQPNIRSSPALSGIGFNSKALKNGAGSQVLSSPAWQSGPSSAGTRQAL